MARYSTEPVSVNRRKILHQGSDPLFSRFHELELPPFPAEDTAELATGVRDRAARPWDQNTVQRLYSLTQGFPFYVHTLALAAADLARATHRQTPQVQRVVNELIDLDILADRDGGLWFVDPVLPVLIALDRVRCETASDPQGLFSGAAGSVEIDAVAAGTEVWVVEAKHRAGGITGSMVDRFRRAADAYRQITGIPIDHRWYVSRSGFRAEGRARCEAAGIYFSTAGDLAQLERALGE